MNADFQSIIKELWSQLKLPAPVFREAGSIALQIDAHELTLGETPDGLNVQISGLAGRLQQDAGTRQRQVRLLLEDNLAQLPLDACCVTLRTLPEAVHEIRVMTLHPCVSGQTAALMRRTEQVLARIEVLAARLDVRAETMRRALPAGPLAGDEMILRP